MNTSSEHLSSLLTFFAHQMSPHEKTLASPLPCPSAWNVATGTSGWALFFHQLDALFPHPEWEALTERYLALSLFLLEAEDRVAPIPLGFWTGLAGVCQVIAHLATRHASYHSLHEQLAAVLFRRVLAQQEPSKQTLYQGVTFRDYDVISGPCGIGAYALFHRDRSDAQQVLHQYLERLVFLAQPSPYANGHLRFYIPPELAPHATFLKRMPEGASDIGFAHGVAGPLALLSLAALHGMQTPGLHQAITCLAQWLLAVRCHDPHGISWASAVPKHFPPLPPAGRPSWCYGTPGVAWALWLAGHALQQQRYLELAITSMETIEAAIFCEHKLTSPILCHGLSGVIIVLKGFLASGAATPALLRLHDRCIQALLHQLSRVSDYRDLLYQRSAVTGSQLLEGIPGIGLTLLSIANHQQIDDPLFPFLLFLHPDAVKEIQQPPSEG